MARSRKDLSPIFKSILGNDSVYWQRPSTNLLEYPCIIYSRDAHEIDRAGNEIYRDHNRYTITLIDKRADNDDVVEAILALQYCDHDRHYIADNLYHDVFTLYY